MKKYVLAMLTMFAVAGLTIAAVGVVVKVDEEKKEITIKEGDKEKVYKWTDDTVTKFKGKDGEVKESRVSEKTWKRVKADTKIDFEAKDDVIKSFSIVFGGKKKKDDK